MAHTKTTSNKKDSQNKAKAIVKTSKNKTNKLSNKEKARLSELGQIDWEYVSPVDD